MKAHLCLVFLLAAYLTGCGGSHGLSSNPAEETSKGWVSSGGEILGDKQNAWFLNNVKVVHYCLAVDLATISLPADRIATLVERGIAYWKKEFAPMSANQNGNLQVPAVGTQDFQRTACDGSEDLRLQFGYGTLDDSQRAYLSQHATYLSVAVRTAYDTKAMRARGFVYVASDKGEHRQPQGSLFIDQPWQYEGLLFRVLLHELGHVFGLPHLGNGLMAELYPETLLHANVATKYETIDPLESFFAPQQFYTNCKLSKDNDQVAYDFLGIPAGDACLYIDMPQTKDAHAILHFSSSQTADSPHHPVGEASGEVTKSAYAEMSLGGKIYLPADQQVFTDPIYSQIKYLPTSIFVSVGFSVSYVATNRAEHPLQITLMPDGYQLQYFDANQILPLLRYRKQCESATSFQFCLDL